MKNKVTFPHIGNYCVPIEVLMKNGLGVDYITPPPITRKTLEIGCKYAPDFVCSPFKYNLGNYIEAIEKGANVLIQVGGACRLGYYGELHEQILKDLGYDITFVNMAKASFTNPKSFIEEFKKINKNISIKKVTTVFLLIMDMITYMDKLEDYIRENVGFEEVENEMEALYNEFLNKLKFIKNKKELKKLYSEYNKKIKNVNIIKPKKILKVGIIGEFYTIMEPESNHFIEKELAKKGIVVTRKMNISSSIFEREPKELSRKIKKYVKYDIGATGIDTINLAIKLAKDDYDGLIHIKSFGCTPEVDAMPILQNISKDYKIPILYLSFDSQTSELGIKTRLEAFYDMIMMRKESKK